MRVNVFDYISEQPVIDAMTYIESGEIESAHEFWLYRMSFEQQQDFDGNETFFTKVVAARYRLMTGGEL